MLTAMLYCKIVLCCNVIIFSLFFFFVGLPIQSSIASMKYIQLHAKSKPTFTIACTIITVIMHAIPNRTLQQLHTIKIKKRNRIFNGRAKFGYLTLLFQVASVSILLQFAVCAILIRSCVNCLH